MVWEVGGAVAGGGGGVAGGVVLVPALYLDGNGQPQPGDVWGCGCPGSLQAMSLPSSRWRPISIPVPSKTTAERQDTIDGLRQRVLAAACPDAVANGRYPQA